MAVRLRPQSAAWMAPHALAAQLTAQTGQIAGQGVAGLLGGIAQGVGAYTQKREQRRVEGINEQRYQDSLMRRDREFKMDAIQTQLGVVDKYIAGVRAEADMAALESPDGTLPPALATKIDAALNSRKGLAAQAAMLAGVPAFEEPTVGTSTPRLTPQPEMPAPPNRPSMTKGDAAVQMGEVYSKMSRDELIVKKGEYVKAIAEASRRLDAIKKIDPARAARASVLTSAIDEANAKMLVIDDQLARRAEMEKRAASAEGKTPETVELGTPAKERSERDKVLDATRYAMSIGYEGEVFPNIETANQWIKDRQITDPNAAAKAATLAEYREKSLGLRERMVALSEAEAAAKAANNTSEVVKIIGQKRLVIQDRINIAKSVQSTLGSTPMGMRTPEYEAAVNDLKEGQRQLIELEKQLPAIPGQAPVAPVQGSASDRVAARLKALGG